MLARQREDGEGARRDGDGLDDEEHVRAGPDPPQRREEDEDRVDVRREPGDLLALEVRDAKRMAVSGRPDRLHHVPEVEAARLEGAVAEDGERGEAGRVGAGRYGDERARPG